MPFIRRLPRRFAPRNDVACLMVFIPVLALCHLLEDCRVAPRNDEACCCAPCYYEAYSFARALNAACGYEEHADVQRSNL
jgi:hypothetical protein